MPNSNVVPLYPDAPCDVEIDNVIELNRVKRDRFWREIDQMIAELESEDEMG